MKNWLVTAGAIAFKRWGFIVLALFLAFALAFTLICVVQFLLDPVVVFDASPGSW